MGILSPNAKMQFFDGNGAPLSGGKLYTTESGGSVPLATYTNAAPGSTNANPIILDTRGECVIFLDPTKLYRYVLKTSADVPIWTQDEISAGNFSNINTSFGTLTFRMVLINDATTARTLLSTVDPSSYIVFSSSSAITCTFTSATSFLPGDWGWIEQAGSGAITFGTSGTTLSVPSGAVAKMNRQHGRVLWVCTAANVYSLDGDLQGAERDAFVVVCSDETSALTAGTAKVTFRMPYAYTITGVRASLTTAQASGSIFTVDINESGTTILSTKLTIDNTEKTSTTAATAAVISDASLASDAEITIDIDQVGNGSATGLKVELLGYPT